MNLGSAGENGSEISGAIERYLVDGYLPTIGIECHVQLATKTKLFSSVDNDARNAEPNSKVSAIDYALPGMLPYLNKEAVAMAVCAGKALNSDIAHESRFDRKHYFYPDLPKGYQISQMYQPIIIGGHVDLPGGSKVRIHHAHLEEDAGKLTHYAGYSLVDLNRAGTPLIEIVAEPDIHSAAEARSYAEELQLLMRYAGVTVGDLYHGNMRFDVNISVAKPGDKLGVRAEVKNLNSFRSVEKATEFEIRRQIDILNSGKEVTQETRGWLDDDQKTISQRSKENAQDYRYMPDADIPPIILSDHQISDFQKDMPMLPAEYREQFSTLDVDPSVVRSLLKNQDVAYLVKNILSISNPQLARRVANLFVSSLSGEDDEFNKSESQLGNLPSADNLIKLAQMLELDEISSTASKEIFNSMLRDDNDPRRIADEKNLLQVSDEGLIAAVVEAVLSDPSSAKAIADIRIGNDKAIGYLVGQVMKQSQGKANPALSQKLIRSKLEEEK